MGHYEVYGSSAILQSVSEHYLADFHIDTCEDRSDLSLWISEKNSRISVWIRELLLIKKLFLFLGEFLEVLTLFPKKGFYKFSAPGVMSYPPVNRKVIYLFERKIALSVHTKFYHMIGILSNKPIGMFGQI